VKILFIFTKNNCLCALVYEHSTFIYSTILFTFQTSGHI